MAVELVQVGIEGISPLLMHSYPMEPIEGLDKMSKEDQAKHAEYRNPDGKLYIPGVAMQRALVAGAAYSKGKGRASLAKVAAACMMVSPEYLILKPQEYNIDSRRVVIRATGGSVIRHRPRFEKGWEVSFDLEYDNTMIKEEQARRVVDDTGKLVGILDFRPACKGPFGRFMVTSWHKVD